MPVFFSCPRPSLPVSPGVAGGGVQGPPVSHPARVSFFLVFRAPPGRNLANQKSLALCVYQNCSAPFAYCRRLSLSSPQPSSPQIPILPTNGSTLCLIPLRNRSCVRWFQIRPCLLSPPTPWMQAI